MKYLYFGFAAATLIASGQARPSVPAPPSPPWQQMLQRWIPGDARCGATIIPASQLRRPYTALSWDGQKSTPRTYRFKIDQRGRAVSITASGQWDPTTTDIAPSLAATNFA